jgi:hypothetical protein
MTMISARPDDRVQDLSPLERKKVRAGRLVLERPIMDALAASSARYLEALERSHLAK